MSWRARRLSLLILVFALVWFAGRRGKEELPPVALEVDDTAKAWKGDQALVSIPDSLDFPFALLELVDRSEDVFELVEIAIEPYFHRAYRPTHLIHHPTRNDILYATSETEDGALLTMSLRRDEPKELNEMGSVATGGSDPAYAAFDDAGDELISVNYASGTVSVHQRLPSDLLGPAHVVTLPQPRLSRQKGVVQHPHQVLLHPTLQDIVLILVFEQDAIYQLNMTHSASPKLVWQADATDCKGLRHGVFNTAGNVLFVVFQTSNTLAAIPLDEQGALLPETLSHVSTLREDDDVELSALSDIKLSQNGERVYVLNRRASAPFPPLDGGDSRGGDTLAIFDVSNPADIDLLGHIELGCWQPREMLVAPTEVTSDTVWVTCFGAEGLAGGVRIVGVDQFGTGSILASWESELGAWGIVGYE